MMKRIAFALFTALAATAAAVEFSGIFRDNMVLQRDRTLPVWGKAEAGEKVAVKLGDRELGTTAGADGKWRVDFPPRPASDRPLELTANTASGSAKIRNILTGDVYLCGGQSNMEWWVANSAGAEEAVKNAANPRIRLFFSDRAISETPQESAKGRWYECNSETVPKFSAVGYFFGRELERELKIPIGLINVSRGASSIEAWMSNPALASLPEGRETLAWYAKETTDYDRKYLEFKQKLAEFNATYPSQQAFLDAQSEARKAGKPIPIKPFVPVGPEHPQCVSGLYNALIHPLMPFAVKGVIFYQGEANVDRAVQYVPLLRSMIADWRRGFENPELIFAIVQIPNYGKTFAECRENPWANLRAAQAEAVSGLEHAGLIVAIDLGDANDLHPKNKLPVGRRLAEHVLARYEGQSFVVDGPTVKNVTFADGAATVEFDHAEGLQTTDGQTPRSFQLAGADGRYQWAEAKIEGTRVVVRSAKVPQPVKIRYAWEYSPRVNLVNSAKLPAMPFQK
ncbi:MAG: sialate O-acetylesterase [Victivallaceae bacterium]